MSVIPHTDESNGTCKGRKVARRELMTITTILCDLDGTLVDSRWTRRGLQHAGGRPGHTRSW